MSKNSFIIKQYEIGLLNNFLYLLGDEATREMAVIDPAWDVPFLLAQAQKLGFKVTKVFLTHAHPDHVNGPEELLSTHDVPVYISRHEAPFLRKNLKNLIDVNNKDKLTLGSTTFDVLHTPGHTPGCQCFFIPTEASGLSQGQLISGDILFIDGCGRCDLPGGDPKIMYRSLHDVIMKLPGNTVVWPGHNYGPTPNDTIAHQKQTNPYLQVATLQEFLGERM